jgi:Predicted phosphoesterase
MKDRNPIAVIADVHGNADALKAVLADIDSTGIGTILNLGDHLSGPLAPGETADILLSREMVSIRGNHDRYLIEQPLAAMGASDRIAAAELTARHKAWLADLPASTTFDDIYLCHGTPASDETYWMETVRTDETVGRRDIAEIEAWAAGIDRPVIVCGHTHVPRAVRLSDGRLLVNPGSVGCPGYEDTAPPHRMETGNPAASYAILSQTASGWDVTFRLVAYDPSRMAARAAGFGRPDWASVVATGWLPRR